MNALATIKPTPRRTRRRKPSVLNTQPHGNVIAETENYTAFEVSTETDSVGFVAAIYRKKSMGYAMTPTVTCMVRSILGDRMANLERHLKR